MAVRGETTWSKVSDADLVKRIRKGDQDAFNEVVTRYSPKVFSLASRFTKSQQDAEEVLQDVFVTVFRKIAGFEGKSSFSSWLYRITVNASFMKLRKRKQDHTVSMEDAVTDVREAVQRQSLHQGDLDNTALVHQLNTLLEESISKLPEEYRPVFVLRDIDGLSSREVSRILRITIPAVKSRLHRSRLMLRRKLLRFYREYAGLQKSEQAVGNF